MRFYNTSWFHSNSTWTLTQTEEENAFQLTCYAVYLETGIARYYLIPHNSVGLSIRIFSRHSTHKRISRLILFDTKLVWLFHENRTVIVGVQNVDSHFDSRSLRRSTLKKTIKNRKQSILDFIPHHCLSLPRPSWICLWFLYLDSPEGKSNHY